MEMRVSDTTGYVLIVGFVILPLAAVFFELIRLMVFIFQNQAILSASPL